MGGFANCFRQSVGVDSVVLNRTTSAGADGKYGIVRNLVSATYGSIGRDFGLTPAASTIRHRYRELSPHSPIRHSRYLWSPSRRCNKVRKQLGKDPEAIWQCRLEQATPRNGGTAL